MWNKTVPSDFVSKLQSFRTSVKSVLLDQEKLVSGVGNWVADEVLYQSGIHPAVKCDDLPAYKATELGHKLIYVCELVHAPVITLNSLQHGYSNIGGARRRRRIIITM